MKNFAIVFLSVFSCISYGQTFRDSTNVFLYETDLQIKDFKRQEIVSSTTLTLLKQGKDRPVKLDLLGMQVDSVKVGNIKSAFIYDGMVVTIPATHNADDTLRVSIYYHGTPRQDERWGGFYFTSDEAFNYGVGMDALPPNFGRVWFPCIDNFTDRARYIFKIHVPPGNIAVCNGVLEKTLLHPDHSTSWIWQMNQEIPTYLASIAAGPYDSLHYYYHSKDREIPVTIFDRHENLQNAKTSLNNLSLWMDVFETRFGTYRWDRIGFVMVPFQGGAMEHATNITLSRNTVQGNLSRETLYAHELSHSWFGNLVTCASEADMWLNEGWASYAESVMVEGLYGHEAFMTNIRQNQDEVLETTHLADGGYFPVYGLPHHLTYSSTVYDKGAMVVHNLRGLLGDSIFFSSVRSYLDHYAFSNCSVKEFQAYMTEVSGVNLQSFFDFWVYGHGFNEISADSFYTEQRNNEFITTIILHQRLLGTENFEKDISTELQLTGDLLESSIVPVEMTSPEVSVTVASSFKPSMIITDPMERRVDAVVQDTIQLANGAGHCFTDCSFIFEYKEQERPGIMHIELHRAANPGLSANGRNIPSFNKYWKISHAGGFPQRNQGIFLIDAKKPDKKYQVLYKSSHSASWEPVSFKQEKVNNSIIQFYVKSVKEGYYFVSEQE